MNFTRVVYAMRPQTTTRIVPTEGGFALALDSQHLSTPLLYKMSRAASAAAPSGEAMVRDVAHCEDTPAYEALNAVTMQWH